MSAKVQLHSRLLFLSALVVSASACGSTQVAAPGAASIEPVSEFNQDSFSWAPPEDYTLRVADVINISVFREQDLSLQGVTIAASGEVDVPLIGSLRAAGREPSELAEEIRRLLDERYLREPSVAVNIVSYAPSQVTVEGAVATPGVYDFRPGTRLSGGISLAEGPVREADIHDVVVFRETDEGMEIAKFDYGAVRAGTMLDPVLRPGDRIVVGTDNLSQFWQDMLRTLPVFALFTRI